MNNGVHECTKLHVCLSVSVSSVWCPKPCARDTEGADVTRADPARYAGRPRVSALRSPTPYINITSVHPPPPRPPPRHTLLHSLQSPSRTHQERDSHRQSVFACVSHGREKGRGRVFGGKLKGQISRANRTRTRGRRARTCWSATRNPWPARKVHHGEQGNRRVLSPPPCRSPRPRPTTRPRDTPLSPRPSAPTVSTMTGRDLARAPCTPWAARVSRASSRT